MATYVVLLKLTEAGRKAMGDPSGLDAVKRGVEAMGAQWKAWYLTMGRYDAVVIVEAPDDETVTKIGLVQARAGSAISETLRAFTEDEYRRMAAALPPAPA
jgi:uncharacterized protein with GYD domain